MSRPGGLRPLRHGLLDDRATPSGGATPASATTSRRTRAREVTRTPAQAIATAFAKWTGTACPSDGTGPSRVEHRRARLGPVDCALVQYNQDQGNQHVIVFRDETWPHDDSSNTLALTTVTYDPDTGEIYDADMEINRRPAAHVARPVPALGYDFASIVTHETGHFLGTRALHRQRATMYAHYAQGATSMRDLTEDDVSGICTIYPPDGTRTTSVGTPVPEGTCDPTPRHGFASACGSDSSKGCLSLAIGARAPTGAGTIATLACSARA